MPASLKPVKNVLSLPYSLLPALRRLAGGITAAKPQTISASQTKMSPCQPIPSTARANSVEEADAAA